MGRKTAALWSAYTRPWGRRGVPPNTPAIGGPPIDPLGPIGLKVEIYLGGRGWEDITAYTLYRDGSVKPRISRGRPDEASRVQPQTATLQVNNRDSRFSPRNPNSPYYRLLGRNTPLRISRMWNGVLWYRYHGEVPEWPVSADISGQDVWVDLAVSGQLRRLQQGTPPVRSAMTAGYLSLTGALAPVAYWPCEEGATSASIGSLIPGGMTMAASAATQFAADSSFIASAPIPVLNGAVWSGNVSGYTGMWTDNVVRLLLHVPAGGDVDGSVIARYFTTGSVARLDLVYSIASSGGLTIKGYNLAGSNVFTSSTITGPSGVSGTPMRVSFALRTSGADVEYEVQLLRLGDYTAYETHGTYSSASIGAVTRVVVNPGASLVSTAVGHISVQAVWDSLFDLVDQLNAWYFENPGDRFVRLFTQQGVNAVQVKHGLTGNYVIMGYQLSDSAVNLAQQVPDTDLGLMYEARDQLAMVYRTRLSLYNQGTVYNPGSAGLVLDWAQNQLSSQPRPRDDDYYSRNDVTVAQIGGSAARQTLDTGALSTQAPPSGIGPYGTSYALSIALDPTEVNTPSIADHAGWRLHMGTVDQPRYPSVTVNLRHPQFTGSIGLTNAVLSLDVGDVIEIDNAPGRLSADPIRLIVQGYSEVLGVYEHDLTFTTSPEDPYRVMMLDDPVLSAADTDGSTLAAPISDVLNANGFFTGGSMSDWTGFRCSLALRGTSGSSAPLPAGGPTGYGVLITPDGSGNSCAAEESVAGNFAVVAGTAYRISSLVYSPLGYSAVTVGVDWLDAGGGYISTSTSSTSVSAGTWMGVAASATAPANAATAYVRVGHGGVPAASDLLYATSVAAWQGAVSVATTNSTSPIWTTAAADFPFDVAVGGERMTVISISGSSSPQTFTVARSANGVAKPQTADTDVRLWQPAILSL